MSTHRWKFLKELQYELLRRATNKSLPRTIQLRSRKICGKGPENVPPNQNQTYGRCLLCSSKRDGETRHRCSKCSRFGETAIKTKVRTSISIRYWVFRKKRKDHANIKIKRTHSLYFILEIIGPTDQRPQYITDEGLRVCFTKAKKKFSRLFKHFLLNYKAVNIFKKNIRNK